MLFYYQFICKFTEVVAPEIQTSIWHLAKRALLALRGLGRCVLKVKQLNVKQPPP
uniref:Uncharacterized protein n=1 Tax=Helianthus annuus TaxID=4232 RepID=A0A251SA15_HELAN